MTRTIRIVGLGSPDRGDDQLGLLAARRLRALLPQSVEVWEDAAGGSRLAEACEGADLLVLIDAAIASEEWPVGSSHRLVYPEDAPALKGAGLRGTHAIPVGQALELAVVAGFLRGRVIIHALAAENFGLGTGLSDALQAPLDRLVRAVIEDVGPC